MELDDSPCHMCPSLSPTRGLAAPAGAPLAVAAAHGEHILAIRQRRHVMNQKTAGAVPDLVGQAVIGELSEYLKRPLSRDRYGAAVARILAPLAPALCVSRRYNQAKERRALHNWPSG